jgi:hypothetical protein
MDFIGRFFVFFRLPTYLDHLLTIEQLPFMSACRVRTSKAQPSPTVKVAHHTQNWPIRTDKLIVVEEDF